MRRRRIINRRKKVLDSKEQQNEVNISENATQLLNATAGLELTDIIPTGKYGITVTDVKRAIKLKGL